MVNGQHLNELIGKKFAGYTLATFIDQDANCSWFEAQADNEDRVLVYVYQDEVIRDRNRSGIHGFKTSSDEVHPETGKAIYVTVGNFRLTMPAKLRHALKDDSTRPSEILGYAVDGVLGHGFKGVTFKVRRKNSAISTPYALKLTIAEEYKGKTWLPEVEQMARLAEFDRDHFPQIHDCGEYTFQLDKTPVKLVYFVEDYIRGETLENVLEEDRDSLDATFLYEFITEVLAALTTMQKLELMHDDLHAGNIQLHEPLSGRRRPYLIDFGSAKPLGPTKKVRDDIRNFASQIAAITNAIHDNHAVRTANEERVLKAAEALHALLSDDDPLRRPDDLSEISERFNREFRHSNTKQTLNHPFDFGNAEEVLDNNLLYQLSAKSFPWKSQIEESSHLLVVGPRGSGKTTVFRSMSFKCLCDAGKYSDAIARPYLGLYISCNKEFRQRFSAIEPEILQKREADIRHYFNLIVLREMIAAIGAVPEQIDADRQALFEFIADSTGVLVTKEKSFMDYAGMEAEVVRTIHKVRMAIWNDRDSPDLTHQDFVADIADFAQCRIGVFADKTLYLFIDDYTEGKIPKDAQRALNHILFVPNSTYKCKISSEVFGVAFDETYGNFLGKDRDYKEWNLGTLYHSILPTSDQMAFLQEIVDNRLKLCNYKGRVSTLIDSSNYKYGTLARTLKAEAELRREKQQKKRGSVPAVIVDSEVIREMETTGEAAYYHGWETICELCTGDVSNILELLNRMFQECGVKSDTQARIEPRHQDSVIESYSKQYLAKIKGIPQYGDQLFDLVNAFGSMSGQLLREAPWIERKPGRKDPYQLIRIELDDNGTGGDDEPAKLWKLLQRYCIFVDADTGRSRRNTLSLRVILRRIFCPAFRIGLTSSESYTIDRQNWEAFCSDPTNRSKSYVKKVLSNRLDSGSQTSFEFEG